MDKRRICYLASGAVIALLATPATQAAGVAAGTLIENTAIATYEADGATENAQSNPVSLRVDELLDVAAASNAAGAVTVTSGSQVLAYSITNTGNGPEAFNLSANPAVSGNDFDVAVTGLAVDTNANGTYEAGVDILLGASQATPLVAADSSLTVFVLVTVPGSVSDGDTSQVELTAAAATGTGSPGHFFAGAGVGGGDAVVGSSGADDTASATLTANGSGGEPSVTLTKSATVADPFGGDEIVPGATVTYTIIAEVTGSGSITDLRVTDNIPAGTTYQVETLALEGTSLTDADDGDAGEASAGGIDVLLGTANAGTSQTVTFAVTID